MKFRMRHIVMLGCVALIVGTAVATYLLHREPWYRRDLDRATELLGEDPQAAVELLEKVAACEKPVPERAIAHHLLGRYERMRDLRKAVKHLSIAWNELEPGDERAACGIVLSALLYQDGRISDLKKILDSLTKTQQFHDLAAEEWGRRNKTAAEAAWRFFKENPDYGIGESHFAHVDYSRQDFAFWHSLDLFRKIGERIGSQCERRDEIVSRVADFVALNVPDLPAAAGEVPRDFANSPGRSLWAGYGSATERAWTLCSILQAMWIRTLIVEAAPESAPVVIVLLRKKCRIYDCATMREVRGEDGGVVSFEDYLKAHPPVNLVDFSADGGARYFVFADPQQVSTRAMLMQDAILGEFATEPTAPVAVNLVKVMYRTGRLLSGGEKDAHAPPWPVPFEFRIDARYQELVRAAASDPAKTEGIPEADLKRAEAAVKYLDAQEALLKKLVWARTMALLGDFDTALDSLDLVGTEAGDNAELRREARYFECLCLYEKGDFAAAQKKLEVFLNTDPGRRESAARGLLNLAEKR